MSCTRMIHMLCLCLCLSAGLTVSSALGILHQDLDCSQSGLTHCKIKNCSDEHVAVRRAPSGPEWDPEHVTVEFDKHGFVPVLRVIWKLKSDAGFLSLTGSEVNIQDESTNQSTCVQFSYKIQQQLNPNHKRWTFSLDAVVQPKHTYMVSVVNLPRPQDGDNGIRKTITLPGCDDRRIQKALVCLENGSLWAPREATVMSVENKKLFVTVGFETAQYSERYQVSIQSQDLHVSKNISKGNDTSLNVTFEFDLWQLSHCDMLLSIQPFFIRCKNGCQCHKKIIDYCSYHPPRNYITKSVVGLGLVVVGCLFYLLRRASHKDSGDTTSSSAAKEQPVGFQVQTRKRVLVIYSRDHPLYKNIVLNLCGFLATKCGTEVVLDLLDSARLGVLGRIQWLDWHREQIQSSSDKILILCSPGVQAKWRAMCGDTRVCLREEVHSPVGDMLTLALSLLVPHFIRSASFEKYIVAYFDGVCSEEDVPSPFNMTVRYKLMKQFEELFFRILDTEKHEPGKVNHIEGLSQDEYHRCPTGRALRDSIEAFHAYQLEHPQWFEEELLETSELVDEGNYV